MDKEKVITECVEKISESFWNRWHEETDNFPDTEDGWDLGVIILQVSFTNLIAQYLLGFQRAWRCEQLEYLIKDFRMLEIALRDTE